MRLIGCLMALAVLVAGTVGCEDNRDKTIRRLEAERQKLTRDLQRAQDELALIEEDNNALEDQLMQYDAELQDARARAYAAEEELERWKSYQQSPSQPEQGWEATAAGDRVTLGSDILFSPGSAKLTSAGQQALSRIVSDVKGAYGDRTIRVVGHTDGDPIRKTKNKWQDNLDLSANRAMAVTRHLISSGVDAKRVETVGMGAAQPIASNGSTAGKARNRRVEIYAVR